MLFREPCSSSPDALNEMVDKSIDLFLRRDNFGGCLQWRPLAQEEVLS